MKRLFVSALLLALASTARAQGAAARVTDATSHGGVIVGPGNPTVLIGGLPAATLGDQATCPQVAPGPVPHVGGPIATGSTTVFFAGRPAARAGDTVVENGPSATILTGAPTVIIGP
jgi:uncharacterized Zn-binding protein involved in type VI secretion